MIPTERAGMKTDSSQEGIALLLVLWVLTILMVVVLAFSYMTKTETLATSSFKGVFERKFLAEAGIERGVMEVFFRNAYKGKPVLVEGGDVWNADGTLYSDQIGDGSYTVRIIDERGKLDINPDQTQDTVMILVLKKLLINLGVEDEQADTIVDSILDWRDADDLQRLHGAETPYYMSLPAPYKAKDGPFDTVEELILVKGMTREILYGGAEKKGLIDFITVNGSPGGININAAPRELLMAMPGITSEIADHIIEIRQTKEITNIKQEFPDIPQTTTALMSAGGISNTYTIEATGREGDERGGYTIRATVTIEGNTFKYVYYKSPAIAYQ
jgi:general secretion pathway protein K